MPYLVSSHDYTRIGVITNALPVCGSDFCDGCGDCLSCFPDCCGSSHWVVYEDDLEAFKQEHPNAVITLEGGSGA